MSVHTFRLLAGLGVVALAIGGCASTGGGEPTSATTTSSVALVTPGTLTMCSNPPYEPFEYLDDAGKVVGLDVAISEQIAKDLGVKFEVKQTPFEGIQSGQDLNVGNCDIGVSGITITDERKQVMDFSDPYFEATQGLLVPGDSTITSLETLGEQKVGVQLATTGETFAKEKGLNTVQFEDLGLQIEAVKTGQVAAAINDYAVLTPYIKSEGMKVPADFSTGEQYGIAIKKGNTALADAVNKTLARIKSDGTYDTIYTEYIGVAPSK